MRSLYESLLDNDINVDEILVADWVSSHEIYGTKIDSKDIKMRGDKYDILPSKPIFIRVNENDNIPFKIGKLNGYLTLNFVNLTYDHLVDECGGIEFNNTKGGKLLKNLTIKINSKYQYPDKSGNGVSFWRCAGTLSSIKNITFDFTDASDSSFDIDVLRKNSLKNIKFINCNKILSNSEAKVTLDDIKDIKGVSKIWSNSGNVEDASFTLVNGKWKQGRWIEAQY